MLNQFRPSYLLSRPVAWSHCTADSDIGIVEYAPNSSDESEDDIADDGMLSLPPGVAKVRWREREDVRREFTQNLVVEDRVFLLGDVVVRSSDQIGQTGTVVSIHMFCDVARADGSTLTRVPTRSLLPLAACRPGALVVHSQTGGG